MRSLLCFATVGIVTFAANGYAQEPAQKPDKAETTKAMYMVTGLH